LCVPWRRRGRRGRLAPAAVVVTTGGSRRVQDGDRPSRRSGFAPRVSKSQLGWVLWRWVRVARRSTGGGRPPSERTGGVVRSLAVDPRKGSTSAAWRGAARPPRRFQRCRSPPMRSTSSCTATCKSRVRGPASDPSPKPLRWESSHGGAVKGWSSGGQQGGGTLSIERLRTGAGSLARARQRRYARRRRIRCRGAMHWSSRTPRTTWTRAAQWQQRSERAAASGWGLRH
jgi:hypothetical protein